MKEIVFWEKNDASASAIMEAMDKIFNKSFVWVTDFREHQSWCSVSMMEHFGLPGQILPDLEHVLVQWVHPFDKVEYQEAMDKRLQGKDLDAELLIHMRGKDGSYSMFSIHTELICDEKSQPEYLVFVIKNESIMREIDALTNLYSYPKYVEHLEKIMAEEERLAILQIQVEGFNTFNLLYGQDYSNELLHAIAWRFILLMNQDRCVYHLEGERFVFILKKAGREELLQFEQQIRQVLAEDVVMGEKAIPLKMGAGAILLENYQGDSSSLRGQVSYALTHSRHHHQGQLVIFNDEVKTSRGVDLALMKVIHQSVQNKCDGFYLEYQPIVDAGNGTVVGAEALLRWSREPYGKVPPGIFIEWMETDPSMYDLGNFVLRTALRETKYLLTVKPDFFVDVNLSVRQLERPEFRRELLNILAEADFPANHLCLELTERCKDFPLDKLRQEVEFFQSCGIRVAMDDYGTGSASSDIVMNIPMDEIKIDMSFIRNIMNNPKNQEMVRSILYFAEKSNMATCLEGVENEELQNYLRDYNATWFQGYYYAKPLPLSELEHMVDGSVD